MRKTVLLSTVALVAGIGLASAQTTPGQEKSGISGQAQSQRHEGSIAQQTREQAGQGRHEQGSAQNAPSKSGTAGQAQRNEGNAQRPQTTGQNQEKQQNVEKQQKQQQPASRAEGNRERTTGQGGQPAASQAQQSPAQQKQGQAQQQKQGQQAQQGTQGRAGQQAHQPQLSPQQGQTTTGANAQQPARPGTSAQQADRAGNATITLNESQRTHIQQTVFARSDVPRVDHVNFALSVGTVVPESVRVVVVPTELVEIRPEWRDDMYFVTGEDIIIVDHSHRIVAIVAAGPTTAMNSGTYGSYASARGTSVNMSADEIRQLQIALNEKGFNVGNPDGMWGPRTQQALIAFQKKQGFQATGRMDQQTMTALGMSSTTTGSGKGSSSSATPSSSTSGQGGGSMNQPAHPSRTQGSSTNLPNSQPR